jgi:tRNA(fMet)-specific endonuclease VapC
VYFLDTSAILELFSATEKGNKIENYLGDSSLAISSITVHELLVGLKESEKDFMNNFLKEAEIISFDKNSAEQSSSIERELRKKGKLINIMDILIAGSCNSKGFNLVTCDNDFLKINGLKVNIF